MSDIESFVSGLSKGIDGYLQRKQEGDIRMQSYQVLQGAMQNREENVAKFKQGLQGELSPDDAESVIKGGGDWVKQFQQTNQRLPTMGEGMKALAAMKQQTTHPQVSPDMANAIASGDQDKVNTQWQKENPNQPMPTQFITMTNAAKQTKARETMAGASEGRTENAMLATALKYSGAGAVQHMVGEATNRLSNIQRAQALIDQIHSQNDTADVRQRTELATSLARTLNPSGVMTNEALNLYIPQTAKGKFGTFGEYLTNESQPVNFSGFLPKLQDLLNREKDINSNLVKQGQSFVAPALQALSANNPELGKSVQNTLNNNPLITPQQPTQPQGELIHTYPSGRKARFNQQSKQWEPYNGQ